MYMRYTETFVRVSAVALEFIVVSICFTSVISVDSREVNDSA